jgi:hypothetical protein
MTPRLWVVGWSVVAALILSASLLAAGDDVSWALGVTGLGVAAFVVSEIIGPARGLRR